MPVTTAPATGSSVSAYNAPTPVLYVVGSSLCSHEMNANNTVASNALVNSRLVVFSPFEVRRTVSVDQLQVFVIDAFVGQAGGGTFGRTAIYRSRTSGEPFPAAVAVDGGQANWATPGLVTHSFTAVQLTPGLYWFAVTADLPSAGTLRSATSAGQSRAFFGFGGVNGTAQTQLYTTVAIFGLPDMSAVSFTNASTQGPGIITTLARISSVP
jgi:hypothetical protein